MSETIEIDDVHAFMLDKMTEDEANVDTDSLVENMIYQTYQMQQESANQPARDAVEQ